jgi:hypothetical protein
MRNKEIFSRFVSEKFSVLGQFSLICNRQESNPCALNWFCEVFMCGEMLWDSEKAKRAYKIRKTWKQDKQQGLELLTLVSLTSDQWITKKTKDSEKLRLSDLHRDLSLFSRIPLLSYEQKRDIQRRKVQIPAKAAA